MERERDAASKKQYSVHLNTYYKGALLWNELPVSTKISNEVIRLKQLVGLRYQPDENVFDMWLILILYDISA